MSLNKSSVLADIQGYLYRGMQEKLIKMYSEIHIAHQRLVENSSGGFWFKGMRYVSGLKGAAQSLHPVLLEFMDDYITQSKAIAEEQSYVGSYIQSVLNQSTEEAHLYCLFPSGLHTVLRDRCISDVVESPLAVVSSKDFNQKGKELLLARMVLNMTGD